MTDPTRLAETPQRRAHTYTGNQTHWVRGNTALCGRSPKYPWTWEQDLQRLNTQPMCAKCAERKDER